MANHGAHSEFVRAYLASGMTQAEFCALHRPRGGPSERTLRSWLAALTRPAGFTAEARAIVERALADLQRLKQALEAVEDAQVPGCVNAPPAAARGRTAARPGALTAVPEPAAAHRRPEDRPDRPAQRTLLDDLAEAVQAAVSGGEGDVQGDEEQGRVRPIPIEDPWSRGGGFLGPF